MILLSTNIISLNYFFHSVKDIFEHQGHEVFTVNNGFDCIQELENGFNGIVLLDIMMPGMDGWDTIKEIVKRGLEKNVENTYHNCNRDIRS